MSVALTLGACAGGQDTVCPAIGWGSALIVEFAEDWPEVPGGVRIECRPECMSDVLEEGPPEMVESPAGTSVTVSYVMSAPDSVAVTVVGADGTELTEVDADLDWRRVGGSEECGGPHEATVVVPAP